MAIPIPTRRDKLGNGFFGGKDTLRIAKETLGKLLVVPDKTGRRVSGMIVEVEAYLGLSDKAAHSYGGRRTLRNEVTYGPGGHVYVFFVYGMYHQLNFVLGPTGHPHVILIRALEPVEGIEVMRQRRGKMKDKNLTSGPGKLCIALDIDRSLNGASLNGDKIWIENYMTIRSDAIAKGKRIGIDYAAEDAAKPFRFWLDGNEYVSRKTAL